MSKVIQNGHYHLWSAQISKYQVDYSRPCSPCLCYYSIWLITSVQKLMNFCSQAPFLNVFYNRLSTGGYAIYCQDTDKLIKFLFCIEFPLSKSLSMWSCDKKYKSCPGATPRLLSIPVYINSDKIRFSHISSYVSTFSAGDGQLSFF